MSDGDVMVIGDLMVDVVVQHRRPLEVGSDSPARVRMAGGGSAANTACWLASMGEHPRLLAARGADHLGVHAADELDRSGVALVGPVVDDAATGTCVVLVDGDGERTMLPDRGANDRLPVAAVVGSLDPLPGWLHLSGYAILHEGSRNAARTALSAALAAGVPVSVDAASTAPIRAVGADAFVRWIDGASIVFANDDEIAALGGVAAVLAHCDAVAVKHGAAGATWSDGGDPVTAEGHPVEAVDSTGAGDAFAAGWIAAVRGGAEVPEALADAVRAGATAVTQVGARPPVPS
ncbi:MAG: hypothetical protein KDA97_01235 [Acidimicrobiales bacterium]|nr:hypothetical protein [Acidimicrobiales bacterium]